MTLQTLNVLHVLHVHKQGYVHVSLIFKMTLVYQLTLTVQVTTNDAQWEGMRGCRVSEVRAGTTSPMPDDKGFKLQ